ncbi:ABC transporter ATP-binding protein [Mycolicibacterium sp. A43C]
MLELDNLGYTHDGRHWLFRRVFHRVDSGQILTVLGPNGRGKTTLLRCMVGLDTPSEGQAQCISPIGYVPQNHRSAFAYTVLDMVLMGRARQLRTMAVPGRSDYAHAHAALDRVGLQSLAQRDYPTLSGGERQLVMIARAIAADSPVLVLDEPTAALDLRNQGRILALLRGLADEGRSVVLTTHHPDHALEIADTVLLLYGGSDIQIGPTAERLTDTAVSRLYGVRAYTLDLEPRRGSEDRGCPARRTIVTRYDQEIP